MALPNGTPDFMQSPDVELGLRRSMLTMAQFNSQIEDYRGSFGNLVEGTPEYKIAADACHQRGADRCLRIAKMYGGVYVKAAQLIASIRSGLRDGGVPQQYVDTLSILTDHAPHKPIHAMAEVLTEGLSLGGWPASELDSTCDLASLSADPIASASLAQVHRAALHDGTQVAVKVQYPELQKELSSDLAAFKSMSEEIKQFSSGYDVTWIVEHLERNLSLEIDFEREAVNGEVSYHQLAHLQPHVYIPKTFTQLSSKRLVTTEYCEGLLKANDPTALYSAGLDVKECATLISDTFAEMIFMHGRVHADPHAGNIYIRAMGDGAYEKRKPQLVILDHGLYCDLKHNGVRQTFCKFWKACCARDAPAVEASGKLLAGDLFRLLPIISALWFVLATPDVSLHEIASAIKGQLPDTVSWRDIANFLASAHAGGGNVVGLFHSLGYIRGILQDLNFPESSRLQSMLKFAMLGDEPSPSCRDLGLGQQLQLHASIAWMQVQISAMAPLARLGLRCCGEKRQPNPFDSNDLYGITSLHGNEPASTSKACDADQGVPKVLVPGTVEATSATSKDVLQIPDANRHDAHTVEEPLPSTLEAANPLGSELAPKNNEADSVVPNQKAASALPPKNNEANSVVSEPDKKVSPEKLANSVAKKPAKASAKPVTVKQGAKAKQVENTGQTLPKLTKEEAKVALKQAIELLEQPKNKKKLKAAVKACKSDDAFEQQMGLLEKVLPLAQEILGEMLDSHGFPREKLMMAIFQMKKHARDDDEMKLEMDRVTSFLG